MSDQYIWRFLREQKIDLAARKSWCQTDDPDFVAKAAEIVGLYLDPPQDAIVLAVDEKPHIQALERAQGYLKLPNGRALSGRSHDYKRNGTSTLFAALDVLSGQVTAGHYKRRRRVEFLDFMNRIVAAYPGKEIHVILDNLSTHKPKRERWLARHPNVRFHFTPTYSSWLNQIEIWFSILQGSSLAGASFTDIQQLRSHIDDFRRQLQHPRRPFRLDQGRRPSEAPQTTSLGFMIPGTSAGSRAQYVAGQAQCASTPRCEFYRLAMISRKIQFSTPDPDAAAIEDHCHSGRPVRVGQFLCRLRVIDDVADLHVHRVHIIRADIQYAALDEATVGLTISIQSFSLTVNEWRSRAGSAFIRRNRLRASIGTLVRAPRERDFHRQ